MPESGKYSMRIPKEPSLEPNKRQKKTDSFVNDNGNAVTTTTKIMEKLITKSREETWNE